MMDNANASNHILQLAVHAPPCQIALCSTCNTTTCTLCVTGATLANGQCSCNSGTYNNENQCVPCPIGCATCTSPTTCTSCKNSTNDNGF